MLLAARRRTVQGAVRALVAAGTRFKVAGREHLPTGPALLAANHLNHADPFLVLAALPTPPEAVGLAAFQNHWVAPLFYLYKPIPVRRDELDLSLVREVLARLGAGKQVLIFPEARISRTGALEEARDGVGYLALQAQVPVIPIALTGSERLPGAWQQGERPPITLTFGPALMVEPDPAQPKRVQRQVATAQIMGAMAALLPPRYRGVYGTAE